MRFVVRFGFLLGILGALFWGDVVALVELAGARDRAASTSTGVVPDPIPDPAPQPDLREAARREYERLRRENLADAEAEARWRAQENAAADREDELGRLREEDERSERPHRRAPARSRPAPR